MDNSEHIQKVSPTEIKVLDDAAGIVEAHVNSMGVPDSDGDVIISTAFDKSIESNLPIPILGHHDQTQIIGKVLTARAIPFDDGSHKLQILGQFNMDTQAGREAFSNVRGEYIKEWSVGFNMPAGAAKMDNLNGQSVRVIEDLDWVETSIVVRGASPGTQTVAAKSADEINESNSASGTEDKSAPDTGKDQLREIELELQLREIKKLEAERKGVS